MCPLCLCGSFHPLALEECILEYILPTKPGRADFFADRDILWVSPENNQSSSQDILKPFGELAI
ncbi:Cell division trigger factor [Microcystis aeruginosa NIES-2481]|nr:Cell division trigger factor [Microcystis aeruginosa NIES-2481]